MEMDLFPNESFHGNDSYLAEGSFPYEYDLLRHSLAMTIVFCLAYASVFLVGVIGNVLVMMVIARTRIMKSAVYYFIFNLALADLLVLLFCLPPTLLGNIYTPWILGWFICKAVVYLQGVSVSASINTLVAISVDRAMAICFPMKCQITSRTCKSIILVIWAYSLTITLPWAVYFTLEPIGYRKEIQICTEKWPTKRSGDLYFVFANGVMCYLLPLTVISVCYILIWHKVWVRKMPGEGQNVSVALMMHRSKIKVIKMLLVVVVLFAFSWLPLYAIFARLKFGHLSEMEDRIIHVAAPIAQWLGASNSCINPILYAFFNNKFRAGFKAILVSRSCCSPIRLDDNAKRLESTRLQSMIGPRVSTKMSVYSSSSFKDQRRRSLLVQVPLDAQQRTKEPFTALSSEGGRHLEPSSRGGSRSIRMKNKMENGGESPTSQTHLYNGESTPL